MTDEKNDAKADNQGDGSEGAELRAAEELGNHAETSKK